MGGMISRVGMVCVVGRGLTDGCEGKCEGERELSLTNDG